MKTEEREQARALRARGCSVKEIARTVGVSTSSVSVWTRDIELSSEARASLHARNPARNGELVRAANMKRARERRQSWHAHGRALARRGDPLHLTGCMLYWAEGSKSITAVQFTNSDADMISLFVRFLRECYDAEDAAIGLRVHLYADLVADQRHIERRWLAAARLPATCLKRSIVNAYSARSMHRRTGRLPYGTCRITLHRAAVVQSIYGAIQEYGGFDRPEWLG